MGKGLGLIHPQRKGVATRMKFLKQISNPELNNKWLRLARYYLGFTMAALNREWRFLLRNEYPKCQLDPPEYYKGMLDEYEKIQATDLKLLTKDIYAKLMQQDPHRPSALQTWPKLRKYVYEWDKAFTPIHKSHTQGKYQELHYKFIHLALPTREVLSKWMRNLNSNCQVCKIFDKV